MAVALGTAEWKWSGISIYIYANSNILGEISHKSKALVAILIQDDRKILFYKIISGCCCFYHCHGTS